jgi:hypothetical protein
MDDAAAEDGEPRAGADDRRWTDGRQVAIERPGVRAAPGRAGGGG